MQFASSLTKLPHSICLTEAAATVLKMDGRHSSTRIKYVSSLVERLLKVGISRFCVCGHSLSTLSEMLAPCTKAKLCELKAIDPIFRCEYLVTALNPMNPLKLDALTIEFAATDTYSRKVFGTTSGARLTSISPHIGRLHAMNLSLRARVLVAYGCPYRGEVTTTDTIELVDRLVDIGCDEIILDDTWGVADPLEAANLVSSIYDRHPRARIAVRFNDRFGLSLANVFANLCAGFSNFETSLGILFSTSVGFSHLIASTEDVAYMANSLGLNSGIDTWALMQCANSIIKDLNLQTRSRSVDSLTRATVARNAQCRSI